MRRWLALFAVVSAGCASSQGATDAPSAGGTVEGPPDAAADAPSNGPDGGSSTTPDGATSDGAPTPSAKTGVLLFGTDAPIVGLAYASGSQRGTTDATGAFRYEAGAKVSFQIGDLALGAAAGADAISPYQIAGSASCDEADDVTKVVALLEALDTNATLADGIQLAAQPSGATSRTLAQISWADLATLAGGLGGKTLPAAIDAQRAFIGVFDGEAWTKTSDDMFGVPDAALRGQGVTTDGTSWFFSGTTGLERTDASFKTTASNALAIPIQLIAAGSDHIGDIDYAEGRLYAPIEDKSYQAPKIVIYDPSSLTSGTIFSIPVTLQTKGVPWVAVDAPRGVAYLAEWDPTPQIHVFALADFSYTRAIDLWPTTGRVQGGKVYKGQLYLTVDDADKHVLKVHLATGTVLDVLTLGADNDNELEGLAFLARPDGTLLHTLDVVTGRASMDFRHHAIVRAPARWKVCP